MDARAAVNLLAWSLQVALIVAAAALAARLAAIGSARVRHLWWRGVLVLCLALPLIQPWRATVAPDAAAGLDSGADQAAGAGQAQAGIAPILAMAAASRTAPGMPQWPVLLTVIIGAGGVLRLAWLAGGIRRLRRLRLAGECADREEVDAVQSLVGARADVRYVARIQQPVTFGIRRPVVLLPCSLRALTPASRRAVLAHELWHVRRRDWIALLAEEGIRSALWFHPALWWLISRVQSSREELVDELTVRLTHSRRDYLEALLAFANKPALGPAAPFARRHHLFTRMLLISKEAVMSSRRIVASCAVMVAVIALTGWYGIAAYPLTGAPQTAADAAQPPRDARPGASTTPSAQEVELEKAIAASPRDARLLFDLAKAQEARGAIADAEATLIKLRQVDPARGHHALAGLYSRSGQGSRAIESLEDAIALNPADAESHHLLATYLFEKASRDPALAPADKLTFILRGIDAEDQALAVKPDYLEALVYKNLLLRLRAGMETDRAAQQALIAEADALRARAVELRRTLPQIPAPPAGRPAVAAPPPPPPPPPPGHPAGEPPPPLVYADTQIRMAGNVRTPARIKDARAVYPPIAIDNGIQGSVVIEATVDESGRVFKARVVRSIPILDRSALDAVRRWEFEPTTVNGRAVPVDMTITVNFVPPR